MSYNHPFIIFFPTFMCTRMLNFHRFILLNFYLITDRIEDDDFVELS